jgi:hypothetical protein
MFAALAIVAASTGVVISLLVFALCAMKGFSHD